MSLSTMLNDLLLLGNQRIDQQLPGSVRFLNDMVPKARTQEEAAVMYFFMLNHFIADASMPCHCDGRKLSSYDAGLHKEMEKHWSRKIETGFDKKNLLKDISSLTTEEIDSDSKQIIQQSRDIDIKFDLHFNVVTIPDLIQGQDVWQELIYICRASFAIACIIAPPQQYSFSKLLARAPYSVVLGKANKSLEIDIDRVTMHDAVINTAIAWKHIWYKVSKE